MCFLLGYPPLFFSLFCSIPFYFFSLSAPSPSSSICFSSSFSSLFFMFCPSCSSSSLFPPPPVPHPGAPPVHKKDTSQLALGKKELAEKSITREEFSACEQMSGRAQFRPSEALLYIVLVCTLRTKHRSNALTVEGGCGGGVKVESAALGAGPSRGQRAGCLPGRSSGLPGMLPCSQSPAP